MIILVKSRVAGAACRQIPAPTPTRRRCRPPTTHRPRTPHPLRRRRPPLPLRPPLTRSPTTPCCLSLRLQRRSPPCPCRPTTSCLCPRTPTPT